MKFSQDPIALVITWPWSESPIELPVITSVLSARGCHHYTYIGICHLFISFRRQRMPGLYHLASKLVGHLD